MLQVLMVQDIDHGVGGIQFEGERRRRDSKEY